MTATDLDTLSLVPPVRFGRLLTDHRWERGGSLEAMAALTSGRFAAADLAEIEAGRRALSDEDVVFVGTAYGVRVEASLHPRRARLNLDLDEGFLAAASHRRLLSPGDQADDVLARYLGLIVTLRGSTPGTSIPLRQDDLDVLADTLWIEPEDIESRLAVLMTNPRDRVGRRVRRLARRAVIPEAGILVAATGEGLLVLDGNGDDPDGGIAVRPEVTGATIIALARRDTPTPQSLAASA